MKNVIIVLAIGLVAIGAWISISIVRQGAVGRFCIGKQNLDLTRVVIAGQGRRAELVDSNSLAYLGAVKKFDGVGSTGPGLTFQVKLYDSLGMVGSFVLEVNTNATVATITCIPAPFAIEKYTNFIIDSNAPTKFNQMLQFLLAETNRGKKWP